MFGVVKNYGFFPLYPGYLSYSWRKDTHDNIRFKLLGNFKSFKLSYEPFFKQISLSWFYFAQNCMWDPVGVQELYNYILISRNYHYLMSFFLKTPDGVFKKMNMGWMPYIDKNSQLFTPQLTFPIITILRQIDSLFMSYLEKITVESCFLSSFYFEPFCQIDFPYLTLPEHRITFLDHWLKRPLRSNVPLAQTPPSP